MILEVLLLLLEKESIGKGVFYYLGLWLYKPIVLMGDGSILIRLLQYYVVGVDVLILVVLTRYILLIVLVACHLLRLSSAHLFLLSIGQFFVLFLAKVLLHSFALHHVFFAVTIHLVRLRVFFYPVHHVVAF